MQVKDYFTLLYLIICFYKLIIFSLGGRSPPTMPPGTYYKPKFFDFMQAEFIACREGVGIIDMSSFSKIEIKVFINYFIKK